MSDYKTLLNIYVVWNPKDTICGKLANTVRKQLCGDPDEPWARRIGIPVYFRSVVRHDGNLKPIEQGTARHSLYIALIGNDFLDDEAYLGTVEQLWDMVNVENPSNRLLPVAICKDALKLDLASEINFVTAQEIEYKDKENQLLQNICHYLCRMLSGEAKISAEGGRIPAPPTRFFLSHRKCDTIGLGLAEGLRKAIDETQLHNFFDAADIAHGSNFEKEIRDSIKDSAFVAIRTNRYLESPWCRMEAQEARRQKRPMIALDAVTEEERRISSLLTNTPLVRCCSFIVNNQQRTLDYNLRSFLNRALFEVLREIYYEKYFVNLKEYGRFDDSVEFLTHSPSPGDLWRLMGEKQGDPVTVIYPDPAVGAEEFSEEQIEIMEKNNMSIRTPSSRNSEAIKRAVVGISISNIAPEDQEEEALQREGKSKALMDDAMNLFAFNLLQSGGKLLYGGDLRLNGFTRRLFEFVRKMKNNRLEAISKVVNYQAWPIHLNNDEKALETKEFLRSNRDVAEFVKLAPSEQLIQEAEDMGIEVDAFFPPIDAQRGYLWARSLTEMRVRMTEDLNARVIIGGKLEGYSGKYPGIVEEAVLALRNKIPTYILGGFGGAAKVVARALSGESPDELTEEYQRRSPKYASMMDLYNNKAQSNPELTPIDYPALVKELNELGIQGLNNGLNTEENQKLLELEGKEIDLPHAMDLVLAGLERKLM